MDHLFVQNWTHIVLNKNKSRQKQLQIYIFVPLLLLGEYQELAERPQKWRFSKKIQILDLWFSRILFAENVRNGGSVDGL